MNTDIILSKLKENPALSVLGGTVLLVLIAPSLFRIKNKRRRRRSVPTRTKRRRARTRINKPAVKRRSSYKKGAKKPWQVKGSIAAKRHMARLRRMK